MALKHRILVNESPAESNVSLGLFEHLCCATALILKHVVCWVIGSTRIPFKLTDLYSLNYAPLLHTTVQDLQTWDTKKLSWFGRIQTFKIEVLPRLICISQTLPIPTPRSFFKLLRSSVIKFVWSNRPPSVKLSVLSFSKSACGSGFPDFHPIS